MCSVLLTMLEYSVEVVTLSLGRSHCIECPHSWPALTAAISVGALVTLILMLNTVATGTINGMIFYANIIAVNQQLFMPQIITDDEDSDEDLDPESYYNTDSGDNTPDEEVPRVHPQEVFTS